METNSMSCPRLCSTSVMKLGIYSRYPSTQQHYFCLRPVLASSARASQAVHLPQCPSADLQHSRAMAQASGPVRDVSYV